MFDLGNIFMVIINLTQIFLQLSIITALFKSKAHWLITLVSSMIISVLYFESLFLMMGVFFASTFIYYNLLVSMRLKHTILAISFQLFLSLYIGSINTVFFRLLIPGANHYHIRSTVVVVYIIIYILIKRTQLTAINLTRSKIIFTLSFTLSFVALSSMMSEYFMFYAEIVTEEMVLNVLGTLVIQTTIVYVIFVLNKFTSEIENAELQKKYTETLEKSLNDWEGYKHGFRNLINTLYGFRKADDLNGLYTHIDTIVNDLSIENSILEINHSIKNNMPYIYGIVLSKASFAVQNEIDFRVRVNAKIFQLKTLNEVQLSRIVGNLLDNAMEHAKFSAEKRVDMEISNHIREKIRIVIKNSVNEKVDTSKIFKKGFSGKIGHTGFGLYEIQTIIKNRREEGWYVEFNVSCTDNTFTADLLV